MGAGSLIVPIVPWTDTTFSPFPSLVVSLSYPQEASEGRRNSKVLFAMGECLDMLSDPDSARRRTSRMISKY